jgi:two-component system, sensor histidine kinase PdtaS
MGMVRSNSESECGLDSYCRILHIILDTEPKRAHGRISRCTHGRDRPQARKLIFSPATAGWGRSMTIPIAATRSESPGTNRRAAPYKTGIWKDYAATDARLAAALEREQELLRERSELLQRQDMLAQEFEHRLVNSLQVIASLLSLQSRVATTAEAAAQLTIAADRVAAFGRVHRQLHLLDHQKSVEFKQYLERLCDDLSDLLFPEGAGRALVVTGMNVQLPTALGIPLGFIVTELITNSSKYAEGNIIVRIEGSATVYALSVSDGGPGLPAEFNPAVSKGLGMKIVLSLVKQVGGTLQFAPGDDGQGTRVTVTFKSLP